MSNDPRADLPPEAPLMPAAPVKEAPITPAVGATHKGIRIFTYPKIIFIVPTLIAALICGIGMQITGNRTQDPKRVAEGTVAATEATPPVTVATDGSGTQVRRFSTIQNVLGVIFVSIFALNLLIMSIDFPRFTVIALVLFFAALGFFLLWLNVYFELLPPLIEALEHVYAVANAGFYYLIALAILVNFGIVWVTRYLDYWEVLPNEILHNHGPFSDLERFPTMNLKFDKEIPDILEYALLRAGRLVLHIPGQSKAIVLDNVLWINRKEEELKKLLSRMEVRITTDREASEPI